MLTMDFGMAMQILTVIVTLRVTKTIEHEKDINLKKTSGPDINTNSYVNQDQNLILKGDVSDDSVYTARPNISVNGPTVTSATGKTNVQLQAQSSSPTTSNKTEIKQKHIYKTKNVNENSIKEDKVNSIETDCKTGYCEKQNYEAEGKTTMKRHNFKNRDRIHGAKWNPPRDYIGPEKEPTDNTIDNSKINIGPEEQYNLKCDMIGNSRFNPYSMLDEKLFAFYVWGPADTEKTIEFTYPSSRVFNHIKKKVESAVGTVDWEKRHFVMIDHRRNFSSVLVEHGPNGRYCLYPFIKMVTGPPISHNLHVQFKQSADGKYLLMVLCESKLATGYLFSRYKDIPRSKKISNIAATMGVSGYKGKSYLYQGHHWMPVEEMDELEYWALEYARTRPEAVPVKGHSPDQAIEELDEPLPDDDEIPNFVPFKLDL